MSQSEWATGPRFEMKNIFVAFLITLVFSQGDLLAQGLCNPPMNNVSNPTMHVPGQRHPGTNGNGGFDSGCRPGLYWNQPGYQYPLVPLYVQPLIQPQEMINIDVVTAEGLNVRDSRSRRVQFYIGRCRDGRVWCQAGVNPRRVGTVEEAHRFVEWIFGLRDFSLRELHRDHNRTPWYVN